MVSAQRTLQIPAHCWTGQIWWLLIVLWCAIRWMEQLIISGNSSPEPVEYTRINSLVYLRIQLTNGRFDQFVRASQPLCTLASSVFTTGLVRMAGNKTWMNSVFIQILQTKTFQFVFISDISDKGFVKSPMLQDVLSESWNPCSGWKCIRIKHCWFIGRFVSFRVETKQRAHWFKGSDPIKCGWFSVFRK